jgi:hypothetical protein
MSLQQIATDKSVQIVSTQATNEKYSIGMDLGKLRDFTVISIAAFYPNYAIIRKIQRIPLGTTYPKIVKFVVDIIRVLKQKGEILTFYWDGTGNEPFSDYMREALESNNIDIAGGSFVFTGGTKGTKINLISNMRRLYETRQLFIEAPNNDVDRREIDALIDEMRNFEEKISKADKDDDLGVFKTGKHDDMVCACALSVKDYLGLTKGGTAYIGVLPDTSWLRTPLGNDDVIGKVVTNRF